MASMGSFPTGVDSSILARSGNLHRPVIPLLAFRHRNNVEIGNLSDCNSTRISRNLTEDLLSRLSPCCGCSSRIGRWKVKRVGATREDGGGGDEPEDALQATINKSKKVLAMQRDLLEQIAERKKLVTSIKNSIMEQEGSDQHSVKINGSTSTSDAASAEDATEAVKYPPGNDTSVDEKPPAKQLAKAVSSLGVQPKEVPAKAVSSVGVEPKEAKTVTSPLGVPAVPWKSAVIPNPEPSSNKTLAEDVKTTADTTVKKPTLPNITPSTNNEKQKDLTESIPINGNAEVLEPGDEDVKPPPLAGVNVMNVILVAAECAPWSKTGGLGDVAGALPKALARRGHRVMVIVPRYGEYADIQDSGIRKRYKVDGQDLEVNYFQTFVDGVDFVFIDSPVFRHIGDNIYGGKREDILKRMVLFCKAAIEVPWYVPCGGVCYGDGNLVFIANDWHTALLPVYLKAYYRDNGLMKYTRSVLVIHNVAHQGRGPVADFPIVDLPPHYVDLLKFYDPVGGEHLNIFAAGLKLADRIVTVSHGYSWELKTTEGGWGLHGIINENDWKLRGIVNGIDTKDWTPELDVFLQSDGYVNYSIETLKTGKAQCKEALQKELGLPVRDVPLIGFIGRLDYQKGVDLIAEAVPWMMDQDVQLVMLGTGRTDLEDLLRKFEGDYKDKVRGWVGFSVKTAHRITAGADILLMPSRFEPCGLNQLYAMHYGTIPVVHAVGGLRDTVEQFNPFEETGLGWTFSRADSSELIHALGNCLWTYREYKQSWEGLQRRGMQQDLSWDNAAQNYEEVLVAAKYQW